MKVFDSLESIPVDFWDILFCSHALEHFESPLQHLEIMKNLLRDNGLLVLVVPKEGHVKDGVHNDFDIHQHLYCWNLRSLANLVTRAGFIVLKQDVSTHLVIEFCCLFTDYSASQHIIFCQA